MDAMSGPRHNLIPRTTILGGARVDQLNIARAIRAPGSSRSPDES